MKNKPKRQKDINQLHNSFSDVRPTVVAIWGIIAFFFVLFILAFLVVWFAW